MEHQSKKEAQVNALRDEDKDSLQDFSNRLKVLAEGTEINAETVRELELVSTELLGLSFKHYHLMVRWLKQGYIGE
jgi:hypothetical protein